MFIFVVEAVAGIRDLDVDSDQAIIGQRQIHFLQYVSVG